MNAIAIRKPFGAISLPENAQWKDRFEIRSATSNRKYIIAKNKKTGQYGCSCMGYRRALKDKATGRSYRKCKHLTEGCGLSLSEIHGNALTDQRPVRKAIAQ